MANEEQAISMLRSTLEKVRNDSTDDYYRIGAQIRDARDKVIARYQPIFSAANVANLSAEDFKSFLLFKNNQHWDSLHRQSNWMTQDMEKLRAAIKGLLDEKTPIRNRLDALRPSGSEPMVKGLGRAVITAILQVMYPDKYGVWNNTAESAMRQLGIWPEFPRSASFGSKYVQVNEVLIDVAEKVGTDLWTLDMLWWRVAATHIPRGIGTSEEIVPDVAEETDVTVGPLAEHADQSSVFALEKYLHEFLVENWEATQLANEWRLLEEDGEVVGSRYYADEVGEIDLLAKHKNVGKWLVVELKRNQTSDSTVGQILRYMSWVRKRLAAPNETVEGLIVCHETDRKLLYALDGQPNITCMTYQVSFSLNPAPGLE